MSIIRSRRLASGNQVGNGGFALLTAGVNQTLVVNYISGRATGGAPFDVYLWIQVGVLQVSVAILPLRGVVGVGSWSGRFVLNPGDVLWCTAANGGPGWVYDIGIFGFSLTS